MQPPPLTPHRPHNPWIPLALVGAAALALLVLTSTCITLLVTQTDTNVVRIALDDIQPGGARLVPLTRFGADTEGRTHGLWIVRTNEVTALALLTIDSHSGCRVEWSTSQKYEGVSPILRDTCAGSIYDSKGRVLFGPASRGLDHFHTSIDSHTREIVIDTSMRMAQ